MRTNAVMNKIKIFFILLTVSVVFLNSVLQLWTITRRHPNVILTAKPYRDTLPDLPRRDGFWQSVSGVKNKFFVYSAYLETRMGFGVRVIAATNRRRPDAVCCRLWLTDGRVFTVPAKVRIMQDNGLLEYSAAFVMCLLSKSYIDTYEAVTSVVSVIGRNDLDGTLPTNLLVVRDTETTDAFPSQIHVCVKPFHSMYNQTEWLLEWLLLNTMHGVTHFYIYNQSMSESTSCLLKNFAMIRTLTILPWQLSIEPNLIRAEVAAYHDCLYRSIGQAAWLLIIDVDEMIFPNSKVDLPQVIASLALADFPEKPVALLFQNAFFYTGWKDDPKSPAPLVTSRKTRRLKEVYPHYNLSKYIVNPATVVELADHFVFQFIPPVQNKSLETKYIGKTIALLHHYRNSCDIYYEDEARVANQCLEFPSVVDRTAQKWTSELWQKMRTEKYKIEKVCGKLS